ncbi:MAG: PQQ-binding-like beta-propeller repeat protein [Planctomycetota bacterium]
MSARKRSMVASLIAGCVLAVCGNVMAQEWPQWRGVNRDARIDDPSLVGPLPSGQLPRRWSVPVGPGYSGPTVADGLVYLTDRQGQETSVQERVICFRADTGDVAWEHAYPVEYRIGYQASGPRASVTIHKDVALAVGGMGRIHCFSAKTGDVIWDRDLATDYKARMPNWGITAAPLVYRDLVIQVAAGSGDACVVALDLATGQERWRALDERAGYSAPIIVRQGAQDVAICWTGDSVTGLDPLTGKTYWSIPMVPRNMPIGVATPVISGDKLFVSSFYDGSMLVQLDQSEPAATQLWRRIGADERNTDALHAMISNPFIKGDAIYGADSYGEFRCLDLMTGDRVWEDLTAVPKARWATVHVIQNGDREIMLNDKGQLLMTNVSRQGLGEQSRTQLLSPTLQQLKRRGGVVWSHPAIADGVIYARNDKELVAAALRE